ncbi:MAG TPA: FaeA/PapI family transcriptional regulator [Longimicrobiales bacterium]
MRLLEEYQGFPLSSFDIADELGLSIYTVRPPLTGLHRAGRVTRWRDPAHDPQEGPAPYLYAVAA